MENIAIQNITEKFPKHKVENGIPYTYDEKTQTYLAFYDEDEDENEKK